ncbi:protein Ku70 [Wilcoxina mikolae CBS 423.85]|nr:protein Ku70 [Wilcoxina mikolae CBS 423.85]
MSNPTKWSPKDDEIEEEEEEEDVSRYQDQKDAVLFAIHISPSMLLKHESEDPKKSPDTSAARTALQCAYSILQERIIASPNDMMGILLFGTQSTRFTGGGFDHCYLLMDLDVPDAASIKELKNLLEDDEAFDELLVPCTEKVSMANVLFGANQIFTTKAPNFQSRKLFLITDDDDPHAHDKALKNSAITRARDLYDLGVQIDPFFMSNPGRTAPFDPSKFYDDIIYRPAYSDEEEDKPLAVTGSGTTKLKEMVSTIRSKATAKRAQFSTTLEIGPGLTIGIKGYIIYKQQTKGRSHYIYTGGEKPQIVTGTTTILADSTAQVVDKTQLKKAYKFGGEQIVFTEEEMKALRNFGPPGLRIIGFKPASAAKFHLSVKPAQFIYPDEKDFVGSTRTFTALHAKLAKDDKVALVWVITRRNTAPALCYLYPSVDTTDPATGRQLQPPGFFLINLPFADDIRNNPDASNAKAPASLIDKMRAVVKQLHMPKGYEPEKYENPSLQWHYRILQAIALEEELPEHPVDKTLPKYKLIDKHAGSLVVEWGEELNNVAGGFAPPVAKGVKRGKEEDGGAPVKKARTTTASAGGGDKEVRAAYAKGTLAKCTVAALKEFLQVVGLAAGGKKVELLERCEEYLDTKG